MFKLTKLFASMSFLALVALLAGACSTSPAPAPTTAPSAPGAAATKAPAAAAADMAPTQELRESLEGGEPPTLDPNTASWDASIAIMTQLWDGLLRFDKELNVVAGIAADIPTTANGGISADAKTYTFKLRPGLKYSDGSALKAGDIVFSVQRMLDPVLAAEYASFYYDITGAEEYNTSKEKDATKLEALKKAVGVEAVNETTVVFKLKQPRASFLSLAALWPVFPLKGDVVTANSTPDKPDKWATDPKTLIGNGPYKLAEWVHQDHITLVPNENYYGTKPKLTKVTIPLTTDAQANYAAFLNGERDIALLPASMLGQVQKDTNLQGQVVRYPILGTFAAQFNNKKPPFDNAKVRQAFSLAIDRQAFVDKIRQGVGKPACSWIPPGMPGYDQALDTSCKLDPTKAKQLLTDAGFPNGQGLPKISMQFSNSGSNAVYAQFLQEQWKTNLGVDVTLEPMESKAYSELVNRKEHMIGWFGWLADYPDPDNWLPELFGTGAGNNKTQYSNTQVDQMMKQASGEPDTQKRLQLWGQVQKAIVDEAPMAFVFHQESLVLVKPWVKDAYFNGMDSSGLPGMRSYWQAWIAKH